MSDMTSKPPARTTSAVPERTARTAPRSANPLAAHAFSTRVTGIPSSPTCPVTAGPERPICLPPTPSVPTNASSTSPASNPPGTLLQAASNAVRNSDR